MRSRTVAVAAAATLAFAGTAIAASPAQAATPAPDGCTYTIATKPNSQMILTVRIGANIAALYGQHAQIFLYGDNGAGPPAVVHTLAPDIATFNLTRLGIDPADIRLVQALSGKQPHGPRFGATC